MNKPCAYVVIVMSNVSFCSSFYIYAIMQAMAKTCLCQSSPNLPDKSLELSTQHTQMFSRSTQHTHTDVLP